MNILVPMAGKSQFFSDSDYPFPLPLLEIGGLTMIERVLENLATASADVNFIFVLNQEDCRRYYLDRTLNIITGGRCHIVKLEGETRGSACSALMAIDFVNNNTPLLIANSDQLIDLPLMTVLLPLLQADAGVVTFESVHPRWSYVKLDDDGWVVEVAEKRPLSKNAIAGLYFFQQGQYFVEAAMQMIRKDESVNGSFFVAPVLNQLVLQGRKIATSKIANDQYHTFYMPQKIADYEARVGNRKMVGGK